MRNIEHLKFELHKLGGPQNVTDEEIYSALNYLDAPKQFIIRHRYSLGVAFKRLEDLAKMEIPGANINTSNGISEQETRAIRYMRHFIKTKIRV